MTAIPQQVLGLLVEVVCSLSRTAALHIVGGDLQVRIPEHLGDERVAAILMQKRPASAARSLNLNRFRPRDR